MGKFLRFGTGNLYTIDRSVVTPTPVKFGTLQEGTIEISFSDKEVFGQNAFPDGVARVDGKISGKAKLAQITAALLGGIFLGETPATGQILPIVGEAGLIPATPGPYTLTVAHGAAFRTNLGVVFTATGNVLTRVAANPATGQYAVDVATGIYTFAAADQAKAVKFDYLYTSALVGKTITINNREAGLAPSFMAILNVIFDGKSGVTILNKCTSTKLSDAYKRDFTVTDFEFKAQADDADEVGTISLPE